MCAILRPPNNPSSASSDYSRDHIFAILLMNLKFVEPGAKVAGTSKRQKSAIKEDHPDYNNEPLIMILPANKVCSVIAYSLCLFSFY